MNMIEIVRQYLLHHPYRHTSFECPQTGQGFINSWIFEESRLLRNLPQDLAIDYLIEATSDCGRHVPDREIQRAVVNARKNNPSERSIDYTSETTTRRGPKWPETDSERIRVIDKREITLVDELPSKKSPVPSEWLDYGGKELGYKTFEVLSVLLGRYEEDPFIALGYDVNDFKSFRLSWIRSFPPQFQFVLPNPIISFEGNFTQESRPDAPRLSVRAASNVGRRNNLVVEFDQGKRLTQLKLIEDLSESVPLIAIISSGKKSLHAWFDVYYLSEGEQFEFMREAASLGADTRMWPKSQPARVPWGLRAETGCWQQVIYLKNG